MRRLIAVIVGVLLPAAASAQETVRVRPAPPAWLGISYEVRWLQEDGRCQSEVVVDHVVQGSPADRAGLRSGDAILALDGQRSSALELPRIASRLEPGDSVRIRIRRAGGQREITAIAERRPDRPPAFVIRGRSDGLRATDAPVVQVTGDTLIAINVEPATGWRGGQSGYWIAHEDGRTEFRRLAGWSSSELDARVADLLVCADTMRAPAPPVATRIDLRALQERADSLRVVITQRAMARAREDAYRVRVAPAPSVAAEVPFAAPGSFIFRVEDHMATGFRGVAGAEVAAMEPELAAYFRNVDRGLLVLRIAPDTPADRAGLRPGDVIVEAGGRRVDAVGGLRALLALPVAGPLEVTIVRKGRTLTASLPRE